MLDQPVSLLGGILITIVIIALIMGIFLFIKWLIPVPSRLTLIEHKNPDWKHYLKKMIDELEMLGFSLGEYYLTKECGFRLRIASLFKDDELITAVVYCKHQIEPLYDYFWIELTIYFEEGARAVVSSYPWYPFDREKPVPPFKMVKYVRSTSASEMLEYLRIMADNTDCRRVKPTVFKEQYEADLACDMAWEKKTYGRPLLDKLWC